MHELAGTWSVIRSTFGVSKTSSSLMMWGCFTLFRTSTSLSNSLMAVLPGCGEGEGRRGEGEGRRGGRGGEGEGEEGGRRQGCT